MRGAAVGILSIVVLLAGCLDQPSTGKGADTKDELAKFVAELPKVYVSDGTLLDPAYDSPDFPRVVQVLLPARGAEPNIGVTSKGGIFVTGFDWTMRSLDGGHTWKRVYDFSLVDNPRDPLSTSDPMLWVDPDTDRVFTNQMFPVLACSSNIISDDNGESWTHYPMSCGLPVVDHQKLMTAHPRGPLPATPLYKNLVYYCYNKLLSTNCAVSYDGGIRYLYDNVAADPSCGGINGHPAAAPDGTVYVPIGLNCNQAGVTVTKDNGLSWTVKMFGGQVGEQDIDPEVTVTPDGTAYYYGRGKDGSGYLWRSHDGFDSVDGPFRVNPPDVKGVVHAALMSGDNGRIAIGYLGNREWAGDPSEAPDNTTWHLFLTHSFNAADKQPTFQTAQVTPNNDPVQIGCIWLNGGGAPCRNLLDFIDGVADKQGRIHVAFADGCTPRLTCSNNPKATPQESRDRALSIAIQDHGPSLYAAQGLLPSLGYTTQVNDPSGSMAQK
jgi:hypothetical protein